MNLKGLGLLCLLAASTDAYSYGFMLRHEYAGCMQCHVDPSGGSTLTSYGRAQGEVLLRSRYGEKAEEPGKVADFLFGLFQLPEETLLSGDVRGALTTDAKTTRVFPMQADITGAITSGKLVVAGSVGLGSASSAPVTLVGSDIRLVSRHHWIGYTPDEDKAWLIRAGRINLPYGLRIPEHIAWARQTTRTDTNISQQHGAAVSYTGEQFRTEVMGIVGNLQLKPMDFREMGYSGLFEWFATPTWTLGASSLMTQAPRDLAQPDQALTRSTHGLMTRWLPTKEVMLSAESNVVWQTPQASSGQPDLVNLVQVDFEPTQGLHLVATAESQNSLGSAQSQFGVWASVWWFFAPHVNMRYDVVTRVQGGRLSSFVIAQLHMYL